MTIFDRIRLLHLKISTLCSVDIEANKICQTKKKKDLANFTGKYLCWSLVLIKLLAFNFIKIDSNTGDFCEIFEIFKKTVFCRTPPVAASGKSI